MSAAFAFPSLSVIILMFNEAESILRTLGETHAFLATYPASWEVLVIDDGSTDDGPKMVAQFFQEHGGGRLCRHERNLGMGAAMQTGIREARMPYFVFNAADGQIPAAELAKMLPLLRQGDVVITRYPKGERSGFRRCLSRGLRRYLQHVVRIDASLEGLYLFPTAHAKRWAPDIAAHTFLFSFVLIQKAMDAGLKPVWGTVRCVPRTEGKSKTLQWRSLMRVAREAVRLRSMVSARDGKALK